MAASSSRQGRARRGKSDVRERTSSKWGPVGHGAIYKFIKWVNLALLGYHRYREAEILPKK